MPKFVFLSNKVSSSSLPPPFSFHPPPTARPLSPLSIYSSGSIIIACARARARPRARARVCVCVCVCKCVVGIQPTGQAFTKPSRAKIFNKCFIHISVCVLASVCASVRARARVCMFVCFFLRHKMKVTAVLQLATVAMATAGYRGYGYGGYDGYSGQGGFLSSGFGHGGFVHGGGVVHGGGFFRGGPFGHGGGFVHGGGFGHGHGGYHTPSTALRHPPPNSARFSYATEGIFFISAQLSSDAVSALRKIRVLIRL